MARSVQPQLSAQLAWLLHGLTDARPNPYGRQDIIEEDIIEGVIETVDDGEGSLFEGT